MRKGLGPKRPTSVTLVFIVRRAGGCHDMVGFIEGKPGDPIKVPETQKKMSLQRTVS